LREHQLTKDDWQIEVTAVQWAGMIAFLANSGWQPSVPAFFFGYQETVINDEHAQHFATAGQTVLEGALMNAMAAYAVINFDMGKFAEVVTFAAEGGFIIRNLDGRV
jgi:hypothetical protein